MDQITDNIFLGNSYDARHCKHYLVENGITAILNCAKDLDNPYISSKDGFETAQCGLLDSKDNTRFAAYSAVYQLVNLINRKHKVLVHCHEGRSRSAMVVASYLLNFTDMGFETLRESLSYIKTKRDEIYFPPKDVFCCFCNLNFSSIPKDSNMNKITDHIFIGDSKSASDKHRLKKNNITAILNCAKDLDCVLSHKDGFEVAKCGLNDSRKNDENAIKSAVIQLANLMALDHTVLVHCGAGKSRSALVVAAYLFYFTDFIEGNSLDDYLRFIKEKRDINYPPTEIVECFENIEWKVI